MKTLALRGVALWILAAAALLIGAIAGASVAQAAPGDRVSGTSGISVHISNDNASGYTWNGTYYYVTDSVDARVYFYNLDGSYQGYFGLTSANDDPTGICWDGFYLYVTDLVDARIYKYDSSGAYQSYFALHADNGKATGCTWDGSYIRVVNTGYSNQTAPYSVYAYTSSGTYQGRFPLTTNTDATKANTHGQGITWNGGYMLVVDYVDGYVYAYAPSGTGGGTYVSAASFSIYAGNRIAYGITWDGSYLQVVFQVSGVSIARTYEGLPEPPFTNYSLPDSVTFAGELSTSVVVHGDWKCLSSTTGETIRLNNAQVTVHGFCAQTSGSSGMEVEVHLSSTAEYADLTRFANVTGQWRFVESGANAAIGLYLYDDSPTTTNGELAFLEDVGGFASSSRLGFATKAKSVSDSDCAENSSDVGFICSRTALSILQSGAEGVLIFSLDTDNTIGGAGRPASPESVSVSRTATYDTATLTWALYGAVAQYEVDRLAAVLVSAGDASRIEYGDPVTYTITGTQAGVSQYQDSTIEAHRTYQYRVRARGTADDTWSAWSDYVYSGATPQVDIAAPGDVQLARDSDTVTISWRAPSGSFDNYTIQRQELIATQGSTLFANIVTIGGNTWLPGASTTYDDSNILPNQTYEYRVAAVVGDKVGSYSDWLRTSPGVTSLGNAPANLRFADTYNGVAATALDDRLETWVLWDAVPGADDYEIQLYAYDPSSREWDSTSYVTTVPAHFATSYGKVGVRVRGRMLDATVCSAASDNRCVTQWTAWPEATFTATSPPPPLAVSPTPDAAITEVREAAATTIQAALGPAGVTVDPALVLQLVVAVVAASFGGMSLLVGWKRGMAPLAVGMGAASAILVLFVGYRVLGTPVAWPLGAQMLIAVPGAWALFRQTGVFR